MCQYSANDGLANARHMQWLGSLATGGHGLVFTEATAVSPVGRHSLHDAGIWRDDHIAAQAPIVEFCRSYGATMGMQIAHAGRKAATLTDGKADAILVARAAMRNPHFAMAAAEQLGEVIEWPPQLDRARRVKQR